MCRARWPLKLLGPRLVTPVGDSNQTTTSARPCSRLPRAGRWQQSKISSRKGSLLPSARRAASPTGCLPSCTSRLSMHPASSTAARSRPTTPLGNGSGSPGLPRVMDSCLLHLPARRLLLLSSRLFGQSARYKMSTLKSMELMLFSLVWPRTGAAGANSVKKSMMSPQRFQSSCTGPRGPSVGAELTTQR